MSDLSHGQLCQGYNDLFSRGPKLKRNCKSDQYKENIEVISDEEGNDLYAYIINVLIISSVNQQHFYSLQNKII